MEDAIEEASATFNLDKGTRLLGMQVAQKTADVQRDGYRAYALDASLGVIAGHSDCYRELTAADSSPPEDAWDREFLAFVGASNLSEWVTTIRDGEDLEPDELREKVENIVSGFDVQAEERSGRLQPHLIRIYEWLKE